MIEIEAAPYLLKFGTFVLSWHGVFSFIGVAGAVFLVGRWARFYGIDSDDIYSIAVWAIISGVIGARLVHVVDNLDYYIENPGLIVAVWSGGIGVWGGILGGFIGGIAYALVVKQPAWIIADITAPALLLAQTIGRLGDIVNGEHCANATDLFYGFIWSHQSSPAVYCANGIGASVQPVIAMEIVWNLCSLFVLWKMRERIVPSGMLFALYLSLYSVGRFMISFLREDRVWFEYLGLQEAHFIALLVLVIVVPVLAFRARLSSKEEVRDAIISNIPKVRRSDRRRQQRNN